MGTPRRGRTEAARAQHGRLGWAPSTLHRRVPTRLSDPEFPGSAASGELRTGFDRRGQARSGAISRWLVLTLLRSEDGAVRAGGRHEARPRIVACPPGGLAANELLAVGRATDEIRVRKRVDGRVRLEQQRAGAARPVRRGAVHRSAVMHRDRARRTGRVDRALDVGRGEVTIGQGSDPVGVQVIHRVSGVAFT